MEELNLQLEKLKGLSTLISSLAKKKEFVSALEEIERLKEHTDTVYFAIRKQQFKFLSIEKYGSIIKGIEPAQ
jgi:HSP90 family molecular chaperone